VKVQILGTGCKKCKEFYENAEVAIRELNVDCELEKIESIEEIVSMGVMVTPALAVDGKIQSTGKVLTVAQIKEVLER